MSKSFSYSSMSAGDALREMYNSGLLKHDFILVSGDVVSNMKLDRVLAAHRYIFLNYDIHCIEHEEIKTNDAL
jgi:hypothetical protein